MAEFFPETFGFCSDEQVSQEEVLTGKLGLFINSVMSFLQSV